MNHFLRRLSHMWSLARRALAGQHGAASQPEWDKDVPPFPVLIGGVARDKAARPRGRLVA